MTRPATARRARATAAAVAVLAATCAHAAGLAAADRAEVRRAVASVGATTSEEPAVRQERRTREPSPAFMLGAALGAWTSAAAQLDFDLKTPSGDGDDSGAIAIDCYDERIAFEHLEARSAALGLEPRVVIVAGALDPRTVEPAWRSRRKGPADRCR